MRFTFVSAATGVWGAELSMITTAASIARAGHDVRLVATSDSVCRDWSRKVGSGARLVGEGRLEGSNRVAVISALLRQPEIKTTDVLLVYDHRISGLIPLARLFRLVRHDRVRYVLDVHDALDTWPSLLNLRLAASASDVVVCVSEFSARSQLGDALRRKVTIRYGPLELDGNPFSPPKLPAEDCGLRVGIVGRISPEKRHDVLLDAVSVASLPHTAVVVGGAFGGELSEDLSRSIDHRALLPGSRIEVRGTVEPAAAFEGIDVLVVCNGAEPMGRTVLEAQARGVPVVVPDSGGASELVEHGVTGWKYEAYSSASLARLLDHIATSPADVESVAVAAREHAARTYDADVVMQSLLAQLARLEVARVPNAGRSPTPEG